MTVLMGLRARLLMAKLQVITDARASLSELRSFTQSIVAGGVDIVQVRDSRLDDLQMARALEVVKEVCSTQVLVATNNLPAATAIGGDVFHCGVHHTSEDARKKLHRWALVGSSAHSEQSFVAMASSAGFDYLLVGPVRDGRQPDLVSTAVKTLPCFDPSLTSKPWFAVGGITEETIDRVLNRGVRRVCVSRTITQANDPEKVTSILKEKLVQSWFDDPASQRYLMAAVSA